MKPLSNRVFRRVIAFLEALPNSVFLVVFLVIPLITLLSESFYYDKVLSLQNYTAFFSLAYFYRAFENTILLGILVSIIVLVLAYPVAYFISRSRKWKGILMMLVLFPLIVGFVIQSFGWMIILNNNGLLNDILIYLGVIKAPIQLLYNFNGMLIGLTQTQLPFMILALVASLSNIDNSVIEASKNLGSGNLNTFRRVILPMSLPGMLAGLSVVFSSTIGQYAVPSLLGGGTLVMSTLAANQILTLADFANASTIATIMVLTALSALLIFSKLEGRSRRHFDQQ